MAQIVFGCLLAGIGGWSYYAKRDDEQLAKLIRSTPVTSLESLGQRADSVQQPGDTGVVAFKAKTFVPPESEIKGDVSKESTSVYSVQVEEVANRNHGHHWVQERRLLTSSTRGDYVYLKDDSGARFVKIPMSNVLKSSDLFVTSSDRFELKDQPNPLISMFGQMSFNLGDASLTLGASTPNRQVMGYRFREFLVPLNRPVYAIGRLAPHPDEKNGLVLKPLEGRSRAIVTYDAPETVANRAESNVYWYNLGAVVFGSLGSALVLHGIHESINKS